MSDYELRTAHDVRKLRSCAVCGEPGFCGAGMVRVSSVSDRRGRERQQVCKHARCMSQAELLALPSPELRSVRLCDVEQVVMMAIMDEMERRRA